MLKRLHALPIVAAFMLAAAVLVVSATPVEAQSRMEAPRVVGRAAASTARSRWNAPIRFTNPLRRVATVRPMATVRAPASARTRFARTRAEIVALARDPAHGGQITPNSLRERAVGMRLEHAGLIPGPIRRELSGASEFVDANGALWDVKSFRSDFPADRGGFRIDRAAASLARELAHGENVIVDTTHMAPEHVLLLKSVVRTNGWQARVVWFGRDTAVTRAAPSITAPVRGIPPAMPIVSE